MNRKKARKIMEEEASARGSLVGDFVGCHPLTVVEALVIWSYLPDCPISVAEDLRKLDKHLQHCTEFLKKTIENKLHNE